MSTIEEFQNWARSVWEVSYVTDPEMSAALEAWQGRQPEIDALKSQVASRDAQLETIGEINKSLRKENASLTDNNKRLAFHNRKLQEENAALNAENERLREDAERLQWLVENCLSATLINADTIALTRDSIDTAMKEEK